MNKIFTLAALALFAFSSAAFADTPTFEINIKDHKFSPSEVKIPKDTKVKLIVNNQDTTPEEFESHELNREKVISGGGRATIFVGPLKAGSYPFFGEFNQATAQGKIIAE